MAEVVGVVAGAVQLATVCHTLAELARRIKGASSSLQDYQKQLMETRTISEAISQNPLLQTPEVEVCIYSLLRLVNKHEHNLKPLIRKSRFFRSCSFISKERELSEVYTSLERHKASLTLVIHNLQAQAIHHIRADIQIMAQRQCPEKPTGEEDSQPLQIHCTQTTSSKELVLVQQRAIDCDEDCPPKPTSRMSAPSAFEEFQKHNMTLDQFEIACQMRRRDRLEHPNANFYYNNVSYGGTVYNGNMYTNAGSTGVSWKGIINLPTNTYVNNYVTGDVDVYNGQFFEDSGDGKSEFPPVRPDAFYNNVRIPQTTGEGQASRGKTYNGMRIIVGRGSREKEAGDDGADKNRDKNSGI